MTWLSTNKPLTLYVLMASIGFGLSCGNSKSQNHTAAKTVDTTPTATPTPTPTPAVTTPAATTTGPLAGSLITQDDCHKLGKVWIPISITNGPPACGEAQTPWPCCKTEVLARFAKPDNVLQGLIADFAKYEGSNLKLNDCGKISDSQYRLHWFLSNGNGNDLYEVTTINTTEEPVAASVTCN